MLFDAFLPRGHRNSESTKIRPRLVQESGIRPLAIAVRIGFDSFDVLPSIRPYPTNSVWWPLTNSSEFFQVYFLSLSLYLLF